MKFLVAIVMTAMFALPPTLAAQAGSASAPAQNPPATTGAPAEQQPSNTSTSPEDNGKKAKVKKVKKVKKPCVSPPANSGLPDYCKNPYWEPKDWGYILSNEMVGR